MKITHYLYNTFLVEVSDKKVAIDPGALFLYYFKITTLIPKSEWDSITHIFVTHGDPDHYWHADRVAKISGAPVICNQTMARKVGGRNLMLGPRSKGLTFNVEIENLRTITVEETIEIDGMTITGVKTTHGPLALRIGPFSKTVEPGPTERIGWGSIGFNIDLGGKRIVNLGDTLLQTKEWQSITRPDVLMIPIGGRQALNTMNEDEALQAVDIIKPHIVIPCHYNCPGLFTKSLNPADDQYFKTEIEKLGMKCILLGKGQSTVI